MEAVAEHINEMQKIYEEYGAIFDELAKMFKDLYPLKKVVMIQIWLGKDKKLSGMSQYNLIASIYSKNRRTRNPCN